MTTWYTSAASPSGNLYKGTSVNCVFFDIGSLTPRNQKTFYGFSSYWIYVSCLPCTAFSSFFLYSKLHSSYTRFSYSIDVMFSFWCNFSDKGFGHVAFRRKESFFFTTTERKVRMVSISCTSNAFN